MRIIDSITIRYFRSVYNLSLDTCKDYNVITGKNDVGKSNILKALNMFFCNQSDYMKNYDFNEDYSIARKEEVKKDTVRGQQFISITIKFLRGDCMPNSLPPTFSVTKRWDMHSTQPKITSDVHIRMQNYAKKRKIKYSERVTATSLSIYLNRIKYVYIPAIKDERVFNKTLDLLQHSLFSKKNKTIIDLPIKNANDAIRIIVDDLQNDFKCSTGIENFVELPSTLTYTDGLLQVVTNVKGGSVSIAHRGDGIRLHYIPKILDYVARNSKNTYIWGFEEPENSYEYRRCMQVAEEFEKRYCVCSQVFITSHSPAFFTNELDCKTIFRICSDEGKTILHQTDEALDEELGYVALYKRFIQNVQELESKNREQLIQINHLYDCINEMHQPIILTEGKTDAALLKLAIKKLGLTQYSRYQIQEIRSGSTSNNVTLLRHLVELRDNTKPTHQVIGMFDRDTSLRVKLDGKDIDIRDCRYVNLGNNVFAFSIPVPHDRDESENISIEHFFTDKEICTEDNGKRLFLGKEFYGTGVFIGDEEYYYKGATNVAGTIKIIEYESKKYVTKEDGTGNYSLSKTQFVECIEREEPGFDRFSFDEFNKIFDIIDSIIHESSQTSS